MNSKIIQDLISEFAKFPTIGPKTAARFVFYLIKQKKEDVDKLVDLIMKLKNSIRLCRFCFAPFEKEDDNEFCNICLSDKRNKKILCIVEREQDMEAIENTGEYNGVYFILGGDMNLLAKDGEERLKREKDLVDRLKNPEKYGFEKFSEVIIALNPTVEGEVTSDYLKNLILNLGYKVTQIAKGIPKGGELEYADKDTIKEALNRRQ
mgnify:CR=1 FL=1